MTLIFEVADPHFANDVVSRYGHDAWVTFDWDNIPWREVRKRHDSDDQYKTLLKWASTHEQPIRNVRLEPDETDVLRKEKERLEAELDALRSRA